MKKKKKKSLVIPRGEFKPRLRLKVNRGLNLNIQKRLESYRIFTKMAVKDAKEIQQVYETTGEKIKLLLFILLWAEHPQPQPMMGQLSAQSPSSLKLQTGWGR